MTSSEIRTFRTLPPEERDRIIKELQSFIHAKREELQAFVKIVKNAAGVVDLRELNPSLEYQKVIRGEITTLETDVKEMRRLQDDENDRDRDHDDDDDHNGHERPIIDQQAIAKAISGNGIINIRPDVKLFRHISKALTYKQTLEKEAREEACKKKDDIKEIMREVLNQSHK